MYVFFWAMLAFFLFCLVALAAAILGKATFQDFLKPGAWSLLFTIIFFFRWSKLGRIEKGLQQQSDARSAQFWQEREEKAVRSATELQQPTTEAQEGFQAQEGYAPDTRPSAQRLQKAEEALQSIKPVPQKVVRDNPNPPNAPLPWKSKARRDEELLDYELRWRLDAKHGKNADEEARQRDLRHSGVSPQDSTPPAPTLKNLPPENLTTGRQSFDIERQLQELERVIHKPAAEAKQ